MIIFYRIDDYSNGFGVPIRASSFTVSSDYDNRVFNGRLWTLGIVPTCAPFYSDVLLEDAQGPTAGGIKVSRVSRVLKSAIAELNVQVFSPYLR